MSERLPTIDGLRNAGLEPLYRAALMVAGAATAIVLFSGPLMNLLVTFGVPITPEQSKAITDLLTALAAMGGPVAVAAAARPEVYAPETVKDILTGPGGEAAGPVVGYDMEK